MKERVQLFTQHVGSSDEEFTRTINEWLAAHNGELVEIKLVIETAMQSSSSSAVTRMAKVHKIVLVVWIPSEAAADA
jgi:hypothetical protein